MTELRVGVLGAGMIAHEHVTAYSSIPGVHVVAVADPVAAKAAALATRVGAATMSASAALLDLDLDIVSVCTPPLSHAELTVAALAAGRNVFCEKPIARTMDDGRRIVDAARAATGLLMVGHVSRFEPEHRMAKEVVDGGALGRIRMMSHSMTTSLPAWSEAGWLADPVLSGGPLLDLGIHSFDYLAWVSGRSAVRVHTVGRDSVAGPNTYALATVGYDDGAMALVETSWAHPPSHGFKLVTELVGTDGRLTWDYDHINGGSTYRWDGDTSWFDPLGTRGYLAEFQAFVDAVRRRAASPVPAGEALTALHTALGALESLRTGDVVDLMTWDAQ